MNRLQRTYAEFNIVEVLALQLIVKPLDDPACEYDVEFNGCFFLATFGSFDCELLGSIT